QKAQTLRRLRPRGARLSRSIAMRETSFYDQIRSKLKRQLAVVVRELGKLVAARRGAKAGGCRGRGRGGITAGGSISSARVAAGGIAGIAIASAVAVPLGVAKVDLVGHHLGGGALVAVFVGPVADLQPALHHGHAALGEIAADKLGGLAPGHHRSEERRVGKG